MENFHRFITPKSLVPNAIRDGFNNPKSGVFINTDEIIYLLKSGGYMATWQYLTLAVENKGRKILENGRLVNSHTKKADLNPLPRNMWNSKGKKMMAMAKGDLLNEYGRKGWEMVSFIGPDVEGNITYFFKRLES